MMRAFIIILPAIALCISPARGHDHDKPWLNDWFMSLQSRGGEPCCDGSDATRLDDVDWESKDGHYRVRIGGEWVDVPDSAVIDAPNRDGPAMVWPYYFNRKPHVRCFIPGTMG